VIVVQRSHFPGGIPLAGVVQRDTYFVARIDPLTKRLIKIIQFKGGDIRTFLLKGMIYKIENGTRVVHPDLKKLLIEMEEQFKSEYKENIAVLEEFYEILNRNGGGGGGVVQCTTNQVCGWCDRRLKDGKCNCHEWNSMGPCYAGGGS
jgi:hypothetical protein